MKWELFCVVENLRELLLRGPKLPLRHERSRKEVSSVVLSQELKRI